MSYLEALDTFAAVADVLSFSQAAKNLRLSQPAVSKQIQQLEMQLGIVLFQRDRKRVVLTQAGETLKHKTLPLLKALKLTMEEASGRSQRVDGSIRFGCLIDAGPFVDWSISFQKTHPGIVIQLEYLDNYQILEAVKSGYLDFGVTSKLPEIESIKSYRIYKEQTVIVTRAQNKRDPEDYSEREPVPFVRFRFRSPLRSDSASLFSPFFNRYKKSLGIKNHSYIFAVNSFPSMIEVLLASDCYAVMPYQTVRKDIEAKNLRLVSEKRVENDLYLIHHDHTPFEYRLSVFRDYLRERSKERLDILS